MAPPPPPPLLPSLATTVLPRRTPSRRVSDLVARFEASSSHAPPPSHSSTTSSRVCSVPVSSTSPVVASGSLSAMDWTPRATNSPHLPLPPSPPKPPSPPAASTASPQPRKSTTGLDVAGKGIAARTVTVPAAVVSSGEGKTRVSVVRAEGMRGGQRKKLEEGLEVRKQRVEEERDQVSKEKSVDKPPKKTVAAPQTSTSSPSLTPSATPTRQLSITFVDTIPRRPSTRSVSAPSPSPLPHLLRPPRFTVPNSTSPSSSPSSTRLSSSTRAELPSLTRASTTSRSSAFTTSSVFPPPTPFSTAPTSSSSCVTRSVPAYLLFARTAEPLVLPDLDRVLLELGGPAVFTPMPDIGGDGDGGGAGEQNEEIEEKERLNDEEWDMGCLSKEGGGEEQVEDTSAGAFGSELEREAWEKWVRGQPPSRWRRMWAAIRRRDLAKEERMERRKRTLVFPPFHLLPPKLTVTDLKANRQRPPPLLSFQSLVLKAANGIVTGATSSYGLSLTTVEGLRDLMQMVTLLVTAASPTLSSLTASSTSTTSAQNTTLFRTVLVTIPSFLSLDFVSAFSQPLIFLLVLTLFTLLALYELYCFTGGWVGPNGALGRGKLDLGEGYDREDLQERRKSFRESYGYKVAITFWLSSVYLPLSKLAIGALAWTDDFWPVANPYQLYNSDDPSPPPLGPSSEYFDSIDFCWKTTMRRREGLQYLNWAGAIVPVAVVVVLLLSLWLPWRLRQVVKREAPRVDPFTELGEKRRDVDGQYEQLLDHDDPSPFNYLYREYRRPWATFRSLYLVVKLVNVLLVVLVDKNNCVFRTSSTTYLAVVRQGCLLAFMAGYCALSAWTAPFLNTPSNSSNLSGRIGYTVLAFLGLLAALSFPGTDGAVIATNVVLYSLNVYFALIGIGVCQRLVKKLQRRLDFSIDIFSPRIDLAKHLSRRVWQESIAALLLSSPELAMPAKEKLVFAREAALPPYLLEFQGSVGERFVESLKILREVGLDAFHDASSYRDFPAESRIIILRRLIQQRFTGVDLFYHPPDLTLPVTSFFGRVDVVPFPFVVVFRYDQQPTQPLHLVDVADLERLVSQNESAVVVASRKVRLALRALEGQTVYAPHTEVRKLGTLGYAEIERHSHFTTATVGIKRNSTFFWQGYNHSSGFNVTFEYTDGVGVDRDGRVQQNQHLTLDGARFGILDDFTLTQPLAALLRRNRAIIEQRLPLIEAHLQRHRDFFRLEAEKKDATLSHSFLLSIFAEDSLRLEELDYLLRTTETNPVVQKLARRHRALFVRLEERMDAVKADAVRGWWALLWDDLWRRNSDVLKKQPESFSPLYRTSLCYNPMPRVELEAYLRDRGFATSGKRAYFHCGFLNQLYFYLDERIFDSSSAIPIHLGTSPAVPFADLSQALSQRNRPPSSPHLLSLPSPFSTNVKDRLVSNGALLSRFTADTGGGTQQDQASIHQRHSHRFEDAYERPRPPFRAGHRLAWTRYMLEERFVEKAKEWLGLTPVLSDWRPSEEEGIVLDLRRGKEGWEVPRRRKGYEDEDEKRDEEE